MMRNSCLVAVLLVLWQGEEIRAQVPTSEEQQYLFSVLPLIEKGQLAQAEEQLRAGIKLYPRSAILHNAQGIVYQRQNKLDKAIGAFQEALALLPTFTAAQLHLAELYRQRGERKEAARWFATAGESTTHFEALATAGVGLAQCEEYGRAIQVLEKAQALRPDSEPVSYNLALARYKMREFQAAWDTLKSMSSVTQQERADLLFLRGQVQHALNQGGSEDLAKACRLEPSSEDFCTEAALALMQEEKPREALSLLEKSLEESPSSIALLSSLGLVQFRLGKYPEAIHSYKRAIEQDPVADASREGLAFLLYMLGDLEQARAVTEEGLKDPDADFYLDQLHAMILYRLSSQLWKEALKSVNRAIKKNPRFAPSFFLRGKIQMEIDELETALQDFETAAQLDSKYALPHYKMAQIFLKQGRMEHAEVARRKFFELGQQREEELLLRQTQDLLMRRAQ
jgi:protein O-GlcNAc transferase